MKDKAIRELQTIGTGGFLEISPFIQLPERTEKRMCRRSNESLVKPGLDTMDPDF